MIPNIGDITKLTTMQIKRVIEAIEVPILYIIFCPTGLIYNNI